jgi:hypothetical protein
MDPRYSIVNQCLQLLKQSRIPTTKKLRVEIQLFQMKRLLLNDAIPKNYRSPGGEGFEGLLGKMQGLCEGNDEFNQLNEVMDHIGGMLSVLDGDQITTEPSVYQAVVSQ